MAKQISPPGKYTVYYQGAPASGAKVYTYLTGTSTPATTYSTYDGAANTNPVICDSRGECDIFLTAGVLYDFVVKTSADASIYTTTKIGGNVATSTDNVYFTAAPTGSTERTVTLKLREAQLSLTDRGADKTGVSDATDKIQAVLDYATANGDTIREEFGATYKVSDTLNVGSNTGLELAGIGKTIFNCTTALTNADALFFADAASNVRFSGFSILGNATGTLGAGMGIYCRTGTGNSVFRVYIENTNNAGIQWEKQSDGTIEQNKLYACGRNLNSNCHGIMVYVVASETTPCANNKVLYNWVRNSYHKGITTYAPDAVINDLLIQGNTVSGSGLGGIYVGDVLHDDIRIIGNYCYGNYVDMEIGSTGLGAKNFVVSHNTCSNSYGDFGLKFEYIKGLTAVGNVVKSAYTTGIWVYKCDGVNFSNTVRNASRQSAGNQAVKVEDSTNGVYHGCLVYDDSGSIQSQYGFYEDGTLSDYNQYIGNTVYNNTAGNYRLYGSNSIYLDPQFGTGFLASGGYAQKKVSLALTPAAAYHNQALPANAGVVVITGPTGAYDVTGLTVGYASRSIILTNNVNYTMTLKHASASSTLGNRIYLNGSADKAVAAYSSVRLTYGEVNGSGGWIEA